MITLQPGRCRLYIIIGKYKNIAFGLAHTSVPANMQTGFWGMDIAEIWKLIYVFFHNLFCMISRAVINNQCFKVTFIQCLRQQ